MHLGLRAGLHAKLTNRGDGGVTGGDGANAMISWDRIDELQGEIGADGFLEVIALFLTEADEVVAALPAVADDPALEAALHFLKGSALNLGLMRLAELCQQGERAAARGEGPAVDLQLVQTVYAQSRDELTAGLAARSAA